METGGGLAKWADLYVSLAGQWSSQTVPIAAPGNNLGSRMLFGDTRLRMQAGSHDQFDLLYSGSRDTLSNWGMPAGLEVLASQRTAPSFVSPYGFQNLSEADQFHFLQAGWSHIASDTAVGVVQARYQYSIAHLDTTPINPPGRLGPKPQRSAGHQCGWSCAARKRRGANSAAGQCILATVRISRVESAPSDCGRIRL